MSSTAIANVKLLTPEQTSRLLGVAVQTLSLWRMTGRHGLPFTKVGRAIRYREDELMAWLESRSGTNSRQITSAVSN